MEICYDYKMAKKKPTKNRIPPQKILVKIIDGIWESLYSHLQSTIPGGIKHKCKVCGGVNFHRKTAVEYAQMILDLTKLL